MLIVLLGLLTGIHWRKSFRSSLFTFQLLIFIVHYVDFLVASPIDRTKLAGIIWEKHCSKDVR